MNDLSFLSSNTLKILGNFQTLYKALEIQWWINGQVMRPHPLYTSSGLISYILQKNWQCLYLRKSIASVLLKPDIYKTRVGNSLWLNQHSCHFLWVISESPWEIDNLDKTQKDLRTYLFYRPTYKERKKGGKMERGKKELYTVKCIQTE